MSAESPSIDLSFNTEKAKKRFLDWYSTEGWRSLRDYAEKQRPFLNLNTYFTCPGIFVELKGDDE